ncbi:MAG TPA: 30S ribosome-binding factor RbfA [Candidatus Faecousia faecigallinarum]|nr:30S ribosome-binding factor RbfA [Candidatus Faecousia faecigallinarum]
MASNRMGRINEEIQRELAALLRGVKDPRVQATMVSVTRVETTPDLRYAKVYVSFLDSPRAAEAMQGLKSASGYLRRALGAALQLRHTPELQWQQDDSILRGAHMLELLNRLETTEDDGNAEVDH